MRAAAVLLVVLVLAACAGTQDDAAEQSEPADSAADTPEAATEAPQPTSTLPPMAPFDTAEATLVAPEGERTDMPVYVAADAETRKQGLMGVTELPREAGMVFVYDDDHDGGFWMKNTLIPLSIAFFDADGQVMAVLDMQPCEDEPCEVYDPGVTYRGALEVNQGRFDELGLESGWTVDLPPDLWVTLRSMADKEVFGSVAQASDDILRGASELNARRVGTAHANAVATEQANTSMWHV